MVRLDVLKLYRGEDVIRQNSEDLDPDQWLTVYYPREERLVSLDVLKLNRDDVFLTIYNFEFL